MRYSPPPGRRPRSLSRSLSLSLSRSLAPAAGLLALAPAALASCGSGSGSHAATATAVSVPASVPSGVTLRVADQLDDLETVLAAAGENTGFAYHVQYSNFVGGPPMLQAFQGGSVDLGFVADTPLIFAQAAHQSIQATAAWAPEHGSEALVTAPGVEISGWADLKGRKVAYQQGTVEEAMLLEGLHSVGLSLKDVTSVNLATTSITPALENGSVAAGILVQPLTAAYLGKEPTARQVLVGNDVTEKVDFLIAADSALANPGKVAAIADYTTRLEKAYRWIDSHPAQWAQTLYVDQYKVPLAEGESIIAHSGPTTFQPVPGSLVAPQQALADLYQAAGEIPAHLDVSAEFNPTFNSVVEANR